MTVTTAVSSKLFGKTQIKLKFKEQATYAAIGFIMGGSTVSAGASPFGVAWAGASPPAHSAAASFGAAAGYLLLLKGEAAVRYIACIALLLALRWAFAFVSPGSMAVLSPFLGASAVAVTGLAAALSTDDYGFIMLICEAVITATSSLLFGKAQSSVFAERPSKSGSICVGIALCVMYMGLSRFIFFGFSPAHSLAFAAILCCGFYSGTGLSSAAAVAAGLSSALSNQPHMLAVCCAAGLGCGIFAPLGRVGCCAALVICSLMGYAAQLGFEGIGFVFAESVTGCIIMTALPLSFLSKVGIISRYPNADGDMLRTAVISQLWRLRTALSDIAQMTGEISKKLADISGDPIESVFAKSCSAVCKGCKSSPRCWQTGYDNTADALNHAFSAAKTKGSAELSDFPAHFKCDRIERMLEVINKNTSGYMTHRMQQRHLSQLRSVSGDQFGGICDLLDSMERQLADFRTADSQTADAVTKYISALGCECGSICCFLDSFGRISILAELPAHKAVRLMSPSVAADLSEIVLQELSAPQQLLSGNSAKVMWSAKAVYGIKSAFVQHASGGNRFCGDSLKVIDNANGNAILLLCDGMGVGSPAAVDATMTASLLERLLSAGADLPSSLRLVNAALLSGGGEERLCTVDAALLDLYSCRLDIFKAGAAPSFVLQNGRCRRIEANSLPAGILSGAEAKHTTVSLSEGDIIVMLSDGVIETGYEWVPSQITAFADCPLDELCQRLIDTAHDRRLSDREDDMSVLAVKIVAA
ncbi:MAG: SpoIIE family protein phosphatase [Oscillospiraceae bacterium]|nr:SpoIIE family protein phosphatase [Oscillospiraceae bacterium]